MKKIFTRLERADRVLMAGDDREVKKPTPNDARPGRNPGGNIGELDRDKPAMAAGSRDGGVNKKPEHDSPDPLPYVWSM